MLAYHGSNPKQTFSQYRADFDYCCSQLCQKRLEHARDQAREKSKDSDWYVLVVRNDIPLTPPGVCVSGGPDSMALAYLLKQVSKSDEIRTKPVAFVVNHNARKGSGEEAKYVGWLLQKLGTTDFESSHIGKYTDKSKALEAKSSRCDGPMPRNPQAYRTSKCKLAELGTD